MLGLAKTYFEVVQRYRAEHPSGRDEIRYFRGQPDLPTAIRMAALATGPNQRTFSHQWRVPRQARQAAAIRLAAASKKLQAAKCFAELLATVDAVIRPIPGIGELTVYDTAIRVGAFLQILPDRVYLHAGVRDGAIALGFERDRSSLEMQELPEELQVLRPHEAEDVLCIFRDDLRSIAGNGKDKANNTPSSSACGPRRHPTRTCS